MATIRTAVFGYGLGGRVFHAPFIHADPEYSLDVIVTSDPGRKAEAELLYPGVRVVPAADQAFAMADELDLAVISTPPATHVPLAAAALEASLAVVVDKPFVIDSAEGLRLIELAQSRGSVLSVFQNRRWDGDFLTIRRLIDDGVLGTVRRFESRMESFKPLLTKPWKGAAAGDGGGILYDLGPHLIDQALQLFGPAELQYAELAAHRGDGGPDDDAFLALRHASGTISHLWMNALAPQAAPRFRVVGSRSAYSKWGIDVQEPSIVAGMLPTDPAYGIEDELAWGLLGFDAEPTKVPTKRGEYGTFYQLMAAAVLRGEPAPVDPQDSMTALRIIESAHQYQS